LPQNYRTNDFASIRVQHTKYSVERTKTCEDNHGEKNRNHATTLNWTKFSCWFETLCDKLQNVSQSLNVSSLETVSL